MPQTTYKGLSARQILRTARIETMKAGNVEIVVNVGIGRWIASLGSRATLFGTVTDVLVLFNVEGDSIRLFCGPAAIRKLEALESQAEKVQVPHAV